MSSTFTITTTSPEQTEALGEMLVPLLPKGSVVALFGDLASGKTCLVRGMAKAISGATGVSSPTFMLVNVYGDDFKIYHLDLYRLCGPEELADLGYEELFDPQDGITVLEWAERAELLLPPNHVQIELQHGGQDNRILTITNHPHLKTLLSLWKARK